jgi:hypothetical protein
MRRRTIKMVFARWIPARSREVAATLAAVLLLMVVGNSVSETADGAVEGAVREHAFLAESLASLKLPHEPGPPLHARGEPVYGSAAGDQEVPAVAFDGRNYLVVWCDYRSGSWDIYGARVSASGSVIDDTLGIAICTATGDQDCPVIAFDGTGYLVVWDDYRSGSWDIYGARVSVGGSVLDPGGVAISTAAGDQEYPAIGFDGTDYLVAWCDSRSGSYDIYGARVSAGGSVLDPGGIAISTAASDQWLPAIAFDGTNYLVVWGDYRGGNSDIYGARVSVGGSVLDLGGIAISTAANGQYIPAIAFDGTNYLVVWGDSRSGGSSDTYGARVSLGGVLLDPEGIAISTAANDQNYPAIGFDGTNYFVVWEDSRSDGSSFDTYGARVSVGGSVLDLGGIAISTAASDQWLPAIAFDGTNYLVVWMDSRSSNWDIYGGRVSARGFVLDSEGIAICTAASDQNYPAITFDGTNYLVVWEDYRAGGSSSDIYGARVSAEGSILDLGGTVISSAASDQCVPAAAFDGTNYLVVWEDYRGGNSWDIYGARVSLGGVLLDPEGIAISTASNDQNYPAIAFDGTNYFVVWEDYRSGGSSSDIYGARVSVGGVVLDPGGIAISTAADDQNYPAIGFDGTNYLVVWEDYRNGGSNSDIYGGRVSVRGSVLDPGGIAISTSTNHQRVPAVAFDGTNYLIAWMDYRNGSSSDIYGARVSAGGSVLDPGGIAISTSTNYQRVPAVAFDGTNYLVVWEDYHSASSWDIYGARVSVGGEVLDPNGLAISTAADDQRFPAIAKGAGRTAAIVYSSYTPAPYGCFCISRNFWNGLTDLTFESVSARAEQGYVTLSWQMAVDVPAASSFRIERSETSDGEYRRLELEVSKDSQYSFSCVDRSVFSDETCWYKIVLVSQSGEEAYGPIEVHVDAVPTAYAAYQSYPNPFNPLCTMRYNIAHAGRVSLSVFDVSGSLVRTLVDAWREPGAYSEIWDGKRDDGKELPSGVYFYSLKAGEFVATHKMVLLK